MISWEKCWLIDTTGTTVLREIGRFGTVKAIQIIDPGEEVL